MFKPVRFHMNHDSPDDDGGKKGVFYNEHNDELAGDFAVVFIFFEGQRSNAAATQSDE